MSETNGRRFNDDKLYVLLGAGCFALLVLALGISFARDIQWNQKCEALGGISTGYECIKGEVVAVR